MSQIVTADALLRAKDAAIDCVWSVHNGGIVAITLWRRCGIDPMDRNALARFTEWAERYFSGLSDIARAVERAMTRPVIDAIASASCAAGDIPMAIIGNRHFNTWHEAAVDLADAAVGIPELEETEAVDPYDHAYRVRRALSRHDRDTDPAKMESLIRREWGLAAAATQFGSKAAAGPDFRSIHWFGVDYCFTSNQAPAVKLLFEAFENRTPDIGDESLLRAVDREAPPSRLSSLFRNHPAWGSAIVPGGSRGTHRLTEPKKES